MREEHATSSEYQRVNIRSSFTRLFATSELESPADGVLKELLVEEVTTVALGARVGTITVD